MWRTRLPIWLALAVLAVSGLAAGTSAVAHAPGAHPTEKICQLLRVPLDVPGGGGGGSSGGSSPAQGSSSSSGCAVPSGGTIDPCGTVTAGRVHCTISLPDLNPADWLAWLACAVVQEAGAIWTAIYSFFVSGILAIVNGLISAAVTLLNSVLQPLQGLALSIVNGFIGALQTVSQFINTAGQSAGPFAPVVVVGLTVILFVGGIALVYFSSLAIIAIGKTIFNLL